VTIKIMSEKKPRIFLSNVNDPDRRREIVEAVLEDPFLVRESVKVRELPITPEEQEMFFACQKAFADVLGDMKLDVSQLIPVERLHIFSKEDSFWKEHQEKNMSAFYRRGHLYCPRESPQEFATILCHEFGHAYAHHSISAHLSSLEEKEISVRNRHEGLGFEPFKEGQDLEGRFTGFNEGVVEQLARQVRVRLIKNQAHPFTKHPFTKEEEQILKHKIGYKEQVDFVLKCIVEVQKSGWSLSKAWKTLVRDTLDGTYHFLKRLETIHPGAVKIIAPMGSSAEDVDKATHAMWPGGG